MKESRVVAELGGGFVVGAEGGLGPEVGRAEDGVVRVGVEAAVEGGLDGGGVVVGFEVGTSEVEGAAGGWRVCLGFFHSFG